uniref:Nucleoside-diphosphate-sugar pyrophosphorylase n=1 Tax=Fervidobacterium pennivorans TaxID=93466 RepID=A0A7V4KEI1_FERPE
MVEYKYIIVQAGRKGTRLGKYTFNKPKALIPVNGTPLLLNTMSKFSGSKFIIIGDYKYEVLRNYLRKYAKEKYVLVKAHGSGTCAGLQEALSYIPQGTPFIITWCDLYFTDDFKLPNDEKPKNYVGLSGTFPCRWSYENGEFREEPSITNGVAGFFIFQDKELIKDVPDNGEFVRYLSTRKDLVFDTVVLRGVKEFGTTEEYEKLLSEAVSRPFNKVTVLDNVVVKEPIDKKGLELAELEIAWYNHVSKYQYEHIPTVLSDKPLKLEKLNAKHPFELQPTHEVLVKILEAISKLHSYQTISPCKMSYYREYYQKTFERLYEVKNIIPHSEKPELCINGKIVPNPFLLEEEVKKALEKFFNNPFAIIHGDPTFSNTMVTDDGKVYFIDPRGYFGHTKIFGDPDYDFAKVYYSLVGNYDKFNRKRFELKIFQDSVELAIESNGYENFEPLFFEIVGINKTEKIKLLHAIIWLSLTTYAWDDYDMICGAFYNGALKLAEVL